MQNKRVDIFVFSKMLDVDPTAEYTQRLFSLLKPVRFFKFYIVIFNIFFLQNTEEKIDLKDFLLCSYFIRKVNDPIIEYLKLVVTVYCISKTNISREEFKNVLRHCHRFKEDSSDKIFLAIDHENKGHISFGEFTN